MNISLNTENLNSISFSYNLNKKSLNILKNLEIFKKDDNI